MKHETSVIDIFNNIMKRMADVNGLPFHSFGLDGQDRKVCGDNLFLSTDKFSIVEYKYTSHEIRNEEKKEKVKSVCLCLEGSDEMKSLHDRCHYIAFANAGMLKANIYRNEVCNKKILGGTMGLSSMTPDTISRMDLIDFGYSFFDPCSNFLTLTEFNRYLKLLLSCGGNDNGRKENSGGLELVISNVEVGGVKVKTVNSLSEAQAWVLENYNRRNEMDNKLRF